MNWELFGGVTLAAYIALQWTLAGRESDWADWLLASAVTRGGVSVATAAAACLIHAGLT